MYASELLYPRPKSFLPGWVVPVLNTQQKMGVCNFSV